MDPKGCLNLYAWKKPEKMFSGGKRATAPPFWLPPHFGTIIIVLSEKLYYRDNISHLFYCEYYRKLEVSYVKNSTRTYYVPTLSL